MLLVNFCEKIDKKYKEINDEVSRISDKILYLGYDGHSGASFGCVMRSMQFIAIHGYDSFREKYIETNSSSSQRI
jgi:hypothetical protein